MRLVIIKSILGEKEKSKIENMIRYLLDPSDFDNWFVVNEMEKDFILMDISLTKFEIFELFLSDLGVLLKSINLNLDDVLDKINKTGMDSLHEYERIYLNEHK